MDAAADRPLQLIAHSQAANKKPRRFAPAGFSASEVSQIISLLYALLLQRLLSQQSALGKACSG